MKSDMNDTHNDCNFSVQVEDIFNESDESSSDEESKNRGDDLDDEENPPEDRLISVENEDTEDR